MCPRPDSPFQLRCHRRSRLHRLQSRPRFAGKISGRAAHGDRRFSLRRFQESRPATVATLLRRIWQRSIGSDQFGDEKFDAIFHLASITDTTLHDQFVQVHDNVESFRRILNFARPTKTRIIYASSAATYGPATEASVGIKRRRAGKRLLLFKSDHGQYRPARSARDPLIGSSSACATSTFTARAKRTKASRQA